MDKYLISTILIVLGLILNLIGTIFLSKGLLLKDSDIHDISGTYWGGNPKLIKHLEENRKNARRGLILLGTGFALQFIGVFMSYFA